MDNRYSYSGRGYETRSGDTGKYSVPFLVNLFRSMWRIRLVEEEIAARYHLNEMKTPVHLMIGQEATAVGACAALDLSDLAYCSHRTHGIYLAKGGDLKRMMSELYCRADGCVGSRGGSMHLIDKEVGMAGTSAIVGGILPIAAGSALASQIKEESKVSAVFFGEAANEEGVTSESLNFAVLRKLPVIFFCENNFYSVCTPLSQRQPITEMHKRAAGFGIRALSVDGSNVLAVYETMSQAVSLARQGLGPTYIEAFVYRFLAHAGATDDSSTGYREISERDQWMSEADPVENYFRYLMKLGVFTEEGRQALGEELKSEIRAAFAHAIAAPSPRREDLFRDVYALG